MKIFTIIALLKQRRALVRYQAMQCPVCVQKIHDIPEAPGSLAGRVCIPCGIVWAQRQQRLIVHPYASVIR